MAWRANTISLTERQSKILAELRDARISQQGIAERAAIILLSGEGVANRRIAQELNIGREKVSTWRNRWFDSADSLAKAEQAGVLERDYRKRIIKTLSDAPRPGCPGKYSPEQICQMIALACEKPEDCGVAASHWSLRSLAQEVAARGIADSISVSRLQVFLKSSGLKTAQGENVDSHAHARR